MEFPQQAAGEFSVSMAVLDAREALLGPVVNSKWLPGIMVNERPILAPKLGDRISLRIEARCRDVEY